MKQDKWTQQLHDKLAEHEMAAPEGLWADIEAALEQQPIPQQSTSRKARFMPLRRLAVAASLAAILVGGGYMWFNYIQAPRTASNEQVLETVASISASKTQLSHPVSKTNNPLIPSESNPFVPSESIVSDSPTLLAKVMEDEISPKETVTVPDVHATESNNTDRMSETALADSPIKNTEQASKHKSQTSYLRSAEKLLLSEGSKKPQASNLNPQLSLYAMNTFGSQNNRDAVLMAEPLVRQFNGIYENSEMAMARSSQPVYLNGYEEHQYHHQPISYGLTLSYPLLRKLSLTTGVIYTRLRSDFTQIMRNQQVNSEQTLHYVGTAVGLNYSFLTYKGLSTYLAGGVKADWNVATHLETEGVVQDMDRDRLQFSFNTSLGVQYNVLPQLGLYAEPGLTYYPDNGSKVQNYFKDKPMSLSLQIGLRFIINNL